MSSQASCSHSNVGRRYHPYLQRKKFKVEKCLSNKSDRISQLPEEILLLILSCLNIKEVGRCSVLSHRWINLWKFNAGMLDIGYEESVPARTAASHVSKVLNNLHCSVLDELRIHYVYRGAQYDPYIDSWIKFALKKGVRQFELDLCEPNGLGRVGNNNLRSFNIPPHFFEHNSLKDYCFPTDVDFSYSSLTSLQLSFVDIYQEQLEYIISKCQNLKQLNLKGAANLKKLNVVGQSLKLEMLNIVDCRKLIELNVCGPPELKKMELLFCPFLEEVHISAKNLVTLRFTGSSHCMFLGDVPALSELSAGSTFWRPLCKKSSKIFNHIKRLERLRLRLFLQDWTRSPNRTKFPRLDHLKQFELIIDRASREFLLFLVPLIKACPSLNTFSIQYTYQEGKSEKLADEIAASVGAAKFRHESLEVLKVSGFVGFEAECEFILRFVAIALSLKKVVIQPSHRLRDVSRDRAQQLPSILPPKVKLVLM